MAFRQSIEVRPDPDFHNDATRLVVALQADTGSDRRRGRRSGSCSRASAVTSPAARGARWPWLLAAAFALATALLGDSCAEVPDATTRRKFARRSRRRQPAIPLTSRSRAMDGRSYSSPTTTAPAACGCARWILRRHVRLPARRARCNRSGRRTASRSVSSRARPCRRVELDSGQSRTISALVSQSPAGGSWNADGVILYSPSATAPLMLRVRIGR